jgi:WD40 repeat protein
MTQRKDDDSRINTGDIHDVSGEVNIAGKDLYKGYTAEQVSVLLSQIRSTFQPKPFDGRCPYKGLDVFEEEDAELFFGREKLIDELVNRVKDSRSVFITGPSGSGKSSLVRAGLIPALKAGAIKDLHSERWLYGTVKPGREPLVELGRVASKFSGSTSAYDEICAKAQIDASIFARWCEIALEDRREKRAVIFIDQFEEVFTQISKETERIAFLDLLTHAATIEDGRVLLLFAMRSDFLSSCAVYPEINTLLSRQFIQIGSMQPDELVSAIAQPPLRVGLRIDPNLIAQIINDIEGEPGTLPLMQFALKDLFDSQEAAGGVIALALSDYFGRGGLRKSLERHADDSFTKLSKSEQQLARIIFSRLIEIRLGTLDTRRTAFSDELIPAGTESREVEATLHKLADARLITTDELAGRETVTISHEKLIDAWPWLRKLVNENRDVITLQNEIMEDAIDWDENNRETSYLYTGARLANAQEKINAKQIVLHDLARSFIDAGTQKETIERIREEENRRKEQSLFYLRRISGASVAVAIVMIVLACVAYVQRNDAIKLNLRALAYQLAAQAQTINATISSRQNIATLLAIRSMQLFPSSEAAQVLLGNLTGHPVYALNQSREGDVRAIAFSPDGKLLASAGGKVIHILEAETGKEISRVQQDDIVYAVAFSPDSKILASGGRDQTVRIWNPVTGAELHRLRQDGEVRDVVFSPDGQHLAGGGFETIRIWDTVTGAEIGRLDIHNTGPVTDLDYSPDGRFIASADTKTARVWDAANAKEILREKSTWEVKTVDFSPDSKYLVSSCDDVFACVWEIDSGTKVSRMVHGGTVLSAAFSHDGKRIVTGSRDNTARVWEALTGNELARITHDGSVFFVSFSPQDFYVLSTANDYTARVWDSSTGKELARKTHDSLIYRANFSPDGRLIASAGADRILRVWRPLPTAEMSRMIYPGIVYTVAFSPDGKYALSGGSDGTARVWEAATDREIGRMDYDGTVFSAAFSPDGKYVVSGGGSDFSVWDFHTGMKLFRVKHGTEVTSLAFSPDGKYVVSASDDPNIRVWEVASGQEITHFAHMGLGDAARFSADGKYIVSAGGKQACVWVALIGERINCFEHQSDVHDAALSPDSRYVVSGDGTAAHVWEVQTGKQTASFELKTDVYNVAFSPDGKYVLLGGNRLTVVWEPLARKTVLVVKHDGIVQRVAFSPDGKYVISGDDKIARIIEVATGTEIARLNHDNLVEAVAISSDNHYALSGGLDKTARVWLWHPKDLIQQTCDSMIRNLNRDEWNTYLSGQAYQAICPELSIEPEPTPIPGP